MICVDSQMKIVLKTAKKTTTNSVFVDSGFVKTCDELVIGPVRVPSQFKSYAKIDDIPQRRRWAHISLYPGTSEVMERKYLKYLW